VASPISVSPRAKSTIFFHTISASLQYSLQTICHTAFHWWWDYLIPVIHPLYRSSEKLSLQPLIIFINPTSGGYQGRSLRDSLKDYLPSSMICDLSNDVKQINSKLTTILSEFPDKLIKCICCGGDGTITWIMDEVKALNISQNVTFGIIPLGTGNDLFSHLESRFGATHEDVGSLSPPSGVLELDKFIQYPEVLLHLFQNLSESVEFDRWNLSINRTIIKSQALSKLVCIVETNKVHMQKQHPNLYRLYSKPFRDFSLLLKNHSFTSMQRKAWSKLASVVENNKINMQKHHPNLYHVYSKPFRGISSLVKKLSSSSQSKVRSLKVFSPNQKCFNNYFGIGIDGEIAQEFHESRKKDPSSSRSRFSNKRHYFQIWLKKWWSLFWKRNNHFSSSSSSASLIDQRKIEITCDGQPVDVTGLQGIIAINIDSYGGGCNLWRFAGERKISIANEGSEYSLPAEKSEREDDDSDDDSYWKPQSSSDGVIEVTSACSLLIVCSLLSLRLSLRVVSRSDVFNSLSSNQDRIC
jgi:hypothetical protein